MRAKRRVTVTEETTTMVVKITRSQEIHCPQCGFEVNSGPTFDGEPNVIVQETRYTTPRISEGETFSL